MNKYIFFSLVFLVLFLIPQHNYSQETDDFIIIKNYEATPVENQCLTSACWAFGGLSFIESELIRTGKGMYNLSEGFIIRNTYIEKAIKYVRLHGNTTFSGGGEFNDVFDMIKKYGVLPESIYPGKVKGEEYHNHNELDDVLKNYLDAVIIDEEEKNDVMMRKQITRAWKDGFVAVLDAYLGEVPSEFTHDGKQYTPNTFAESLGLNRDDYVYLTSFSHHPYYEQFILELPDNWSWGKYHNVKIEELMETMKNSIMGGYTFCWAGDVSEEGFNWRNGTVEMENDIHVTEALRQDEFDRYKTTDDHGMHITGLAENEEGEEFFIAKNSWGVNNKYDGYLYMSEKFIKFKTIAIVVHKDAIPKHIFKKLNIVK